jgi:hypothetical protein
MRRFLRDLVRFAIERRKWWLLPLLLVCVVVSLIAVALGHPAVAPFLYSLF